MAWGRKKSGGRREPQFGLAASLSELRLRPEDRVAGRHRRQAGEETTQAESRRQRRRALRANRSQPRADREANADPRQGRAAASRVCSIGARCSACGRVIAAVGMLVWVGAHLPPIQSLEIPKRPPTIQITGSDGSVLVTRGEMAGSQCLAEGPAALSAERLHRHRRPQVLLALRNRSLGHRPRGRDQRAASWRFARWLDPHPTACQEPFPDPGAHAPAQIAGSRTGALAGAQAFQEGNPRALPQPRLFRLRRLWRRGGRAALFRQIGEKRHDRGSRHARGPGQIALAAGAEPQSRRGGEARPDRA